MIPARAKRRISVAVIGASAADKGTADIAYDTGFRIAKEGWTLICGGLGGVMEHVSKGAFDAGGQTVGILPGYAHDDANEYIKLPIPTGLGHARNAVIASSANGIIAIGGEYGTLSEIALGLKMGKPVVGLSINFDIKGVLHARTPEEAISILKGHLA